MRRCAIGPHLDVECRGVRRAAGEANPPAAEIARSVGDRPVMAAGRAEASERGCDRCLLWREKVCVSAQISGVNTAGKVFFDRCDRRLGIEVAVVDTVGCDDDVGGEPVAAHVRAFPHQIRPAFTQGASDGPSSYGATGVVLPVSADEEHGRKAEFSGGTEGSDDLRQVLVTAPRAPLLAVGAGALIAQYGPATGAFGLRGVRAA